MTNKPLYTFSETFDTPIKCDIINVNFEEDLKFSKIKE